MNKKEIIRLLGISDKSELAELYDRAYQVKLKNVGKRVFLRGIIEMSNICEKNCFYCGIRKDNQDFTRYEMTDEEIIKAALWADECNYGSIVIQAGERSDSQFTNRITQLLNTIKNRTDGRLGVTLSLGEQSREAYQQWYDAGAHRYLLRIETTNQQLYRKCHPTDHSYTKRLESLKLLKELNYQVGTGVLIGLPGQELEHLADDILFFKEFDIDMIGMGPYIVHDGTPFANLKQSIDQQHNFELALKMIAVTRIFLEDVNIASTTALQALDPQGREMGLKAGANIIMPNITETKYREGYQLYNDKPCLDENADMCRFCLEKRVASIGEEIGYQQWGDSPHFLNRKTENETS